VKCLPGSSAISTIEEGMLHITGSQASATEGRRWSCPTKFPRLKSSFWVIWNKGYYFPTPISC
jgi:hypothetical protein